ATDAQRLRDQAATVITQRASALSKLIQSDPHAALTFAFSPELLKDLANKFPESSARLESHTTVTGQVRHWIADYSKGSRSWWSRRQNGGTLNLHFAEQEPPNLKSGRLLQATGVVIGPDMAVETGIPVESSQAFGIGDAPVRPARHPSHTSQSGYFLFLISGLIFGALHLDSDPLMLRLQIVSLSKSCGIFGLVFALACGSTPGYAQNSCSTMGVQKTIVILATFPGVTPPPALTPQSVSDMFFATTMPSLASYWQEASYGSTTAAGD